jgi:Predicted membrane protein (DUF2157)
MGQAVTTRHDALVDVIDIIRRHNLTLEEVSKALQGGAEYEQEKSSGTLTKVLGYIGGILIFCGIGIFTSMQWESMNATGRIMVTLGIGFCAFIMAVVSARDSRYERAATPLFLVAVLLEPTGIIVMLREFSRGGDPAYGFLFMNGVMLMQQGLCFYALRRTVLAFTSLVFGVGFFAIAFNLMYIDAATIGLILGLSLLCIGWSIDKSEHKPIASITYLVGSIAFLSSLFDFLEDTVFEVLFLGVSSGLIFLSTIARSRMLLFIGTLATIGFIGYFSGKHFEDALGWPLILMLMGAVLIGLSALAVKLNKKYIR